MYFALRLTFFLCLCTFTNIAYCQGNLSVDSLIALANNSASKGNCDSTTYFLRKAIKLADIQNNETAKFDAEYHLSFYFSLCDLQIDSAYYASQKLLEKANNLKKPELIAFANNSLGALFYKIREYGLAVDCFEIVIEQSNRIDSLGTKKRLIGRGYLNLVETQIQFLETQIAISRKDELIPEILQRLETFKVDVFPIFDSQEDESLLNRYMIYWLLYKGLTLCILNREKDDKGEQLMYEAVKLAEKEKAIFLDDIYYYCAKGLNYKEKNSIAYDYLDKALFYIKNVKNKNYRKIEILKELNKTFSKLSFYKKADSISFIVNNLERESRNKLLAGQFIKSLEKVHSQEKKLLQNETKLLQNNNFYYQLFLISFFAILTIYFFLRKRHERRQNQIIKELNTANIAKQTFVSVLAHQSKGRIDTLKNQIITFKNNINPTLDKVRKNDLELIEEFTQRLSNTFHNFLVWARPSGETDMPMKLEFLNLSNEFGAKSEFGKESISEGKLNGIQVSFEFPMEYNISADRIFTTVIMRNIVENAVKYSEGKNLNIFAKEEKDKIQIIFEDDGKGIPPSKLNSEIFEFDAPLDDKQRSGGFGLKISRKLARQQGGTFKIYSNTNQKGTKVILTCKRYKHNGEN